MTAIRATRGLELPRHLRGAGRTLLYLLLGLPYGITYLVVVGGGLLLGAVLSIAWIGLPLLAAVTRLVWQLAEGERRTGQPAGSTPTCRPFRARPAATGATCWRRPGTGRSGARWRCCCSSCRSRSSG